MLYEVITHCDVLAFGQQQECLIGSVDLVYRNSWNERNNFV